MMTFNEAKQRLNLHQMRLSTVAHSAPQEYRVAFAEEEFRKAEKSAYYTDDLEDAALTGAMMRARKGQLDVA